MKSVEERWGKGIGERICGEGRGERGEQAHSQLMSPVEVDAATSCTRHR